MSSIPHLLLTGGAGYIGAICAHLLARQGYQITILDNLTGGAQAPHSGAFIQGDVRNTTLLDDLFSTRSIDAVLHFAGKIQVGESVQTPLPYYDSNVVGTMRLLEAMAKHNIQHFVFSSTAAVYGNPQYLPIDEKHPISPVSPYGSTKAMAEQLIQECCHAYGLNAVILRYFNAAGALPEANLGENHIPETHFIPLLIQSALRLRPPFKVYGDSYETRDGSCIRDYVHVYDLATAHIKALHALLKGQIKIEHYNLGSGSGYSVFEVIHTLEQILQHSIEYTVTSSRKGDPARLITNSNKARHHLGWTPIKSIEDILQDALTYIRFNHHSLN